MIRVTASRLSPIVPSGRVIFEGSIKDLQSLLNKLKIARNWDSETRNQLDADEIKHAIADLQ